MITTICLDGCAKCPSTVGRLHMGMPRLRMPLDDGDDDASSGTALSLHHNGSPRGGEAVLPTVAAVFQPVSLPVQMCCCLQLYSLLDTD